MSPTLAAAIAAAEDLAWRPFANLGGRGALRYHERLESHRRLVDCLVSGLGFFIPGQPAPGRYLEPPACAVVPRAAGLHLGRRAPTGRPSGCTSS